MTVPTDMKRGWLLRLYLLLSHAFPLIGPRLLRKRLARGKEDQARWQEKLGRSSTPRPDGPLIWLNAVGLGEILSLRGLIVRMARLHPDAHFLVTSTTIASAQVFARNLPPRTVHHFLPIDAPAYRHRFLDKFQPDLCIWVEQDLWPGMVSDLAARSIPQAIVAARMGARSYQSHRKAAGLYHDLYRAMALITAQDDMSADHLRSLGAQNVTVTGSLKPAAPPLECDADELAALKAALGDRTVWAVAPSHPPDEEIARQAQTLLRQTDPDALLIITPRFPDRAPEIAQASATVPKRRSRRELPGPDDDVWICDTFGELGLVYRLSILVLIGGTFNEIEGHNPWEAALLNTAIAHGPRTGNFVDDFTALHAAGAAAQIDDPRALAELLKGRSHRTLAENAAVLAQAAGARTDDLARRLVGLVEPRRRG